MAETDMPYRTILFDLDGTLIDHFRAIYRCYCYAQEKLGLECVSFETVKATVGGSVPVTMERLVGKAHAEAGVRYFREHFESILLEDLYPLPGSHALLEALSDRGVQTAVFTNKNGSASKRICEHLGYTKWTHGIFGTLEHPWRKPQPEFTQFVLEQLNADPKSTLMVGDSPFDVAAARTANLPCHCVTTGSHDADGLSQSEFPPDASWPDLIALAKGHLGITLVDT